jgi:hypothetical protein
MVSSIVTRQLWAFHPSGRFSWSVTVGTPVGRPVLGEVSLARVAGSGHAKAFIRQRCDRVSPDQVQCGISINPDEARSVERGTTISSLTFEVEVNRAYGWANAMVFIF